MTNAWTLSWLSTFARALPLHRKYTQLCKYQQLKTKTCTSSYLFLEGDWYFCLVLTKFSYHPSSQFATKPSYTVSLRCVTPEPQVTLNKHTRTYKQTQRALCKWSSGCSNAEQEKFQHWLDLPLYVWSLVIPMSLCGMVLSLPLFSLLAFLCIYTFFFPRMVQWWIREQAVYKRVYNIKKLPEGPLT